MTEVTKKKNLVQKGRKTSFDRWRALAGARGTDGGPSLGPRGELKTE